MRVTIVFHSVCGNTYLLAKEFYQNFVKYGVEVSLYRVEDSDLEEIAEQFPVAQEYLAKIKEVPVLKDKQKLLETDYLLLGSPTYFGNVSAEMKAFMDSLSCFWMDAELQGTKLIAFASSAVPEGGGGLCLQAINTFGQHLGMNLISIPTNLISQVSNPAYGLLHFSGPKNDQRPGQELKDSIQAVVEMVVEDQ